MWRSCFKNLEKFTTGFVKTLTFVTEFVVEIFLVTWGKLFSLKFTRTIF